MSMGFKTSRTQIPCQHTRFPPCRKLCDEIFEIHKPAKGLSSMEIVFLHGLEWGDCTCRSAYFRTWMTSTNSECWLKTWLVECFPRARILAVSYDADISTSPIGGREDLYLIGEKLANALIAIAGVGQKCPVVLVGHSVGGLVLKETCLKSEKFSAQMNDRDGKFPYKEFLTNLSGAFFYATPNLGSEILNVLENKHKGPLLEYLKVLDANSSRINGDFQKLCRQYDCRTYGVTEANLTDIRPYDKVTCLVHVVDEASARPGMDDFFMISGVNHFTICKPVSKTSSSFVHLERFLARHDGKEGRLENHKRALELPPIVINLEDRLKTVVEMLQLDYDESKWLALVGMYGVGKSSLAKQVLLAIQDRFDYTCFVDLAAVRPYHTSDRKRLEFKMLVAKTLFQGSGLKFWPQDVEEPPENTWMCLEKKNVLLILDDVTSEEEISEIFEPDYFGAGSRVIVISSNQNVMPDITTHSVPFFSSEESEALFKAYVGSVGGISEELVSRVVEQCDGLPLTLKEVGKFLRRKEDPKLWECAIARLRTADALDGTANGNEVWQKLKVSIENLAFPEKKLLLDIATFDHFGPTRRQYDINVLESAWNPGTGGGSAITCGSIDNLVNKSLMRVCTVKGYDDTRHVYPFTATRKVYIHEQLRDVAKSISKEPKPEACRSVWKLDDLKMLINSKEENPCTEVLSVDQGASTSTSEFMDQSNPVPVKWSFIRRMKSLRFLRISNVGTSASGKDLVFPQNLAMLHLENCSGPQQNASGYRLLRQLRKFVGPKTQYWPILEKNVESLKHISVLLLENCSSIHLPGNFHELRSLKILHIHSNETVAVRPLPEHFGHLPQLKHLSIDAPMEILPASLLQLSTLQSMALTRLEFMAWPLPEAVNPSSHLMSLRSLELKNLPKLAELPDSFGAMSSLRYLKLFNCPAMVSLPDGFDGLQQLKILKIEECDGLERLCESFHSLRSLRYLTLRKLSKFAVFPSAFGNLQSLRYLRLEDCVALEGLPSSFGGLQSLREMHITSCQNLQSLWPDRRTGCRLENLWLIRISKCLSLQSLPQSFGELSALKRLTIGCCDDHENKPARIRSLDLVASRSGQIRSGDHDRVVQSIGPISRLQKLRLSHCGSPRGSLDHLTALTSMDIEGCHTFKNLLHSLGRFTALTRLVIRDCENCVALSESIGNLSSLSVLKIERCKNFATLPNSVDQLSSLTELHIIRCQRFKRIPTSIGRLASLSKLTIQNCMNLSILPDSVGHLTALFSLQLWGCDWLETLPEGLGRLRRLQHLSIPDCKNVSSLPDCLRHFKALRHLEVKSKTKDGISGLPESLQRLTSLSTLRIVNCAAFWGLLEGLGNLTSLEELKLEDCRHLQRLPDNFGQLAGLKRLRIWKCGNLRELPGDFRHLTALVTLDIYSCENLRALPASLDQLQALRHLRLRACRNLQISPTLIGELGALTHLSLDRPDETEVDPDLIMARPNRITFIPEYVGEFEESYSQSSESLGRAGFESLWCGQL